MPPSQGNLRMWECFHKSPSSSIVHSLVWKKRSGIFQQDAYNFEKLWTNTVVLFSSPREKTWTKTKVTGQQNSSIADASRQILHIIILSNKNGLRSQLLTIWPVILTLTTKIHWTTLAVFSTKCYTAVPK